ncbi:MAG: hypothetical protein ACLFUH_09305 [Bacteroidales bacterium]
METRTTVEEVKNILDTDLDDAIIEDYIETANLQVTDTIGDKGLGEDRLRQIEKYLAAHFVVVTRERQAEMEEIDNARIRYAGTFGKYLEMSSYGQQVLILDTTGNLASSGKRIAGLWSIDTNYNDSNN